MVCKRQMKVKMGKRRSQGKVLEVCQHCGKMAYLEEHHLEYGNGRRKFSETERWCHACHFGEDGHRTEGVPNPKTDSTDRTPECISRAGRPFSKAQQTGRKEKGEK